MRIHLLLLPALFVATQAAPQTTTPKSFESGYANSKAIQSETFNPTTRDANGNRIVLNGILQMDSSNTSYSHSAASNASLLPGFETNASKASVSAVANLLSITISGNHNTIILNSRQTNSGNVTAILNGTTTTTQTSGQKGR